jgi:hypothetical protein
MSRLFTATTGQMLQYVGSMGVTNRPTSILTWVKLTTVSGTKIAAYNNAAGSYMDLDMNSTKFRAVCGQSTGGNAVTTATPTAGVWYPVLLIYDAAGAVKIRAIGESVTGGNAGTFTAESSPNFCIGNDSRQPAVANIDGKISHVAVWDSELSAPDVASILAGAVPSSIDFANLMDYWALTDTSLTGINGRVLAVTGTVAFDADNPAVGSTVLAPPPPGNFPMFNPLFSF